MARSKLKRKPAPEPAALVLPYGADDSGKPARAIEVADAAPPPPYRTPAPPPPSTPFGAWLLGQVKRDDWVGSLAKGLKTDPGFPKRGDPEAVRKRLREIYAEGDAFEALDDAELEWLCH